MANNILYVSKGEYGTPAGYLLPLVQGQFGQSVPLEIRDLAGNVVPLTGYSTITGHKRKGGSVTALVGTFTLSGTPTVAPQITWVIDEDDTGQDGAFSFFLEITNGSIVYTTHPVSLTIVKDPAVNATPAPGLVSVTTAQRALLATISGLTGLIKMAAGTATGIAVQSFMETFLASATAIAARINLLPSYTGNAAKVLAVNATADDVEWVAQSGGGGSSAWGGITGTLSDQTDLQTALNGKETAGAAATVQGNLDTHTGNTSNPHSVTAAQVGASALRPTQTDIAGTTHTFTTANEGQIVASQSGSATVFTVPLNSAQAFAVGAIVGVERQGAGTLAITATSGVTLNGVDGASKSISTQWAAAALRKVGTNAWVIIGAIS